MITIVDGRVLAEPQRLRDRDPRLVGNREHGELFGAAAAHGHPRGRVGAQHRFQGAGEGGLAGEEGFGKGVRAGLEIDSFRLRLAGFRERGIGSGAQFLDHHVEQGLQLIHVQGHLHTSS